MTARVEQMTEAEYRGWIVGTARAHGWLVHSLDDSNVSAPNVMLARGGVLILARVKAERAKVSDAQQEWLDELGRVPGITVEVFRPSQMAELFSLLTTPALEVVA